MTKNQTKIRTKERGDLDILVTFWLLVRLPKNKEKEKILRAAKENHTLLSKENQKEKKY